MIPRKHFLAILGAGACGAAAALSVTVRRAAAADANVRLAEIERRTGGRLGVYARELGSARTIAYRASERFPMCSTFKTLAVGAVLARVDRGLEHLERMVLYGTGDLLEYAPVTRAHVNAGAMTVRALCAAAMTYSDNTAANLLLGSLGGPHAVTAFVRSSALRDPLTRLDRTEPSLNTAIVGDPRDTTTPSHIAHDLELLLASDRALSTASRGLLEGWMRACTTGTHLLRAGVPASWIAADKTGSGENATRNDLALFRRPQRPPIVVAAYLTRAHAVDGNGRDAALADVARVVAAALA